MIKLKLREVSNLKASMASASNIACKVGSGANGGASIQSVLDSITVSNGLKDTRGINKLDISGEELQTRALTNLEIEKILKK